MSGLDDAATRDFENVVILKRAIYIDLLCINESYYGVFQLSHGELKKMVIVALS